MPSKFNYYGPGNKSRLEGNRAVPVDKNDSIAADHDDNYTLSKTKKDIYKADSEAIKAFGREFIKSGNKYSALGAVSLGLKTGVERITNSVYYPRLGKLCQRTHTLSHGEFLVHCKKILKENHFGLINITIIAIF